MGLEADKAYEEAQAKTFREWKASLTVREYWSWQWDRHRHFLAGAAVAAALGFVFWWLLA